MLELCRQRGALAIECELNEAVRNLGELLRGALSGGIRLESRGPQVPLWIRCAPGQVDRVLLNLVLNARDAMPDGGTISIALERTVVEAGEPGAGPLPPGSYAVLTVADTGDGVPQELLGRIFERRFTTKPEGRGSGLGLAVVGEVVSALGGDLQVESEIGKGTKFSIRLPLASRTEAVDESVDRSAAETKPTWVSAACQVFSPSPTPAELARRSNRLGGG